MECRNGVQCVFPNCRFVHPPAHVAVVAVRGPCRFGINCRRADCYFAHPVGSSSHRMGPNSSTVEPELLILHQAGLSPLATSSLPQAPIIAEPTVSERMLLDSFLPRHCVCDYVTGEIPDMVTPLEQRPAMSSCMTACLAAGVGVGALIEAWLIDTFPLQVLLQSYRPRDIQSTNVAGSTLGKAVARLWVHDFDTHLNSMAIRLLPLSATYMHPLSDLHVVIVEHRRADGTWPRAAFEKPFRDFEIGDDLDVRDPANKWFESEVIEMRNDEIHIHFKGWAHKHDAWFSKDSSKLAPLSTHTDGAYLPERYRRYQALQKQHDICSRLRSICCHISQIPATNDICRNLSFYIAQRHVFTEATVVVVNRQEVVRKFNDLPICLMGEVAGFLSLKDLVELQCLSHATLSSALLPATLDISPNWVMMWWYDLQTRSTTVRHPLQVHLKSNNLRGDFHTFVGFLIRFRVHRLSMSQATDDDLVFIAGISSLNSLNLNGSSRVTAKGLSHLAALPLTELGLRNCSNIEDHALLFLENMPLVALDIYHDNHFNGRRFNSVLNQLRRFVDGSMIVIQND